jgi:hypothetical protein
MITGPSFESRIRLQSRPYTDQRGNVAYEHNSYLEGGEMVEPAIGGTTMQIHKAQYRDPLTRQEFIDVLVTLPDGRQETRQFAVSAVRRVGANAAAPPKSY